MTFAFNQPVIHVARPEKALKAGAVEVTAFANRIQKDGKTVKFPSISIHLNYKDKNGKWQKTHYFGLNDLPKVLLLVSKMYELYALKTREIKREGEDAVPTK